MRRPAARALPPADRVAPTPAPLALLLGAAGGGAVLLAFPPYGWWPLLPVGLALLSAALLVRSAWTAVGSSLAFGIAFFLPLTAWANTYAGFGPWAALALVESSYLVLYGLLARAVLVRRGPGIRSAITLALLWAGVEALRSHWPWGGLPWGASAFALQDSPLLRLGPWIGTAGLAAVVALIGQLLCGGALSLLGRREAGRERVGGLVPIATAAVVVAACLVVPSPHNPPAERASLRIAGIQGNVPRIDPQTLAMPEEIFANSLEQTGRAVDDAERSERPLDLVVWPEDSTGWDAAANSWVAGPLTAAAVRAGAPLLVGTQRDAPEGMRYNTALLWTAQGGAEQTYDKRHPVPFGEYIPARDLFRRLSDKVDLVSTDMRPGSSVGVMDVDGTPVGVLICFEIAYENLVQDTVDAGAQVIVVQSNNALFGDSHEAVQQLAEARVLAVISGRSVVHVSTVGESAIIAPDGRVLDHAGHWVSGVVQADVPLRTGITPAVAAGPWIAVGLAALGLAGVCAALASPHRAIARRTPRRTR